MASRTEHGFQAGAAKVEAFATFPKTGAVVIGITTPKGCWQVYVTKTGKVRISKDGAELKLEKPLDIA